MRLRPPLVPEEHGARPGTDRAASREAAVLPPRTVHAAYNRCLEDAGKVTFDLSDAALGRDESYDRVDNAAGKSATKPDGRIVFDPRLNPADDMLSLLHRRMLALVEVGACPMPVQESLFSLIASRADPEERIVGGTSSMPHVVSEGGL